MDFVSFVTGLLSASFALILFRKDHDEESEEELYYDDQDVGVTDFANRNVTLSCQTCRKLKKHKEVSPNLFQCVKCKRHVDLRAS